MKAFILKWKEGHDVTQMFVFLFVMKRKQNVFLIAAYCPFLGIIS